LPLAAVPVRLSPPALKFLLYFSLLWGALVLLGSLALRVAFTVSGHDTFLGILYGTVQTLAYGLPLPLASFILYVLLRWRGRQR
jgi:hypothetical protein